MTNFYSFKNSSCPKNALRPVFDPFCAQISAPLINSVVPDSAAERKEAGGSGRTAAEQECGRWVAFLAKSAVDWNIN